MKYPNYAKIWGIYFLSLTISVLFCLLIINYEMNYFIEFNRYLLLAHIPVGIVIMLISILSILVEAHYSEKTRTCTKQDNKERNICDSSSVTNRYRSITRYLADIHYPQSNKSNTNNTEEDSDYHYKILHRGDIINE